MNRFLVLINCEDAKGIIAAISNELAAQGANIVVMREFVDTGHYRFFARFECEAVETFPLSFLEERLKRKFNREARIRVSPLKSEKKVAVLVTREYHCLGDLLVQHFFGLLDAEVCCVIGNRDYLSSFTERFSIPFFHISHEGKSKSEFESALVEKLSLFNPDFIILAKFMRILSQEFVSRFSNRILNIHHSFLPAFAGANPYRQAFERGVKIIGATAHFVIAELDNGPIISQETYPVDHNFSVAQMRIAGQEIEKRVLNKAVSLVLNDRVFVAGNRTIIFE